MGNFTVFNLKWMEAYQDSVLKDAEYSWISRHMNCSFVWKIGEDSFLFNILNGEIISITVPTWNDSWDFSIEGPLDTWMKFIERSPMPIYNDLLGMLTRLPQCELKGNRLMAMQYMRSLTRLFTIAREVEGDKMV
jgi:putative sterol carrier protein